MLAYVCKKKFTGCCNKDFDRSSAVFRTLARMCRLYHDETSEALLTMVNGGALWTYSDKMEYCATYIEAITMLKTIYKFPDRRSRILTAWQALSLSAEMDHKP